MKKDQFFALLRQNLKFHNRNGDSYKAADMRAEAFHDPKTDAPRDWIHHAASIVIGETWYITFSIHRNHAKAEAQTAIFARWLAEWQNGEGLEVDIEIAEEAEQKARTYTKRLITCCKHHDVTINEQDARAIVNTVMQKGPFILGTAWKMAQAFQTERRRADVLAIATANSEPEERADVIRRIMVMDAAQIDKELAFLTCRFTMSMDDLIAAVANADDPQRYAADLEILHRVGTVANLAAVAARN
ncbi:hypothetical protein CUW27_20725 [Salmonella enterica]|nr:hypothetical protein [Salmonella enterica]